MEETHRDWKNLPAEVLQLIFQHSTTRDSRKLAFICRAWKNPAQAASYANVTIKTILRLERFHNTMEHSPHLGKKVKTISLEIENDWEEMLESTRESVLDHVTSLLSNFLPNLEELNGITVPIYAPAVKALSNTHLKYLKRLQPPSNGMDLSEVINYVSCANLMRDRIEEVYIIDDFYCPEDIRRQVFTEYERLYNSLNQLDKLTTILIQRETNDEIQVLEHMAEACKSLKHIQYYFILPEDEEGNIIQQINEVSVNSISNYTPRPNIKSLEGLVFPSNGRRMLSYIINKFPGLNSLGLKFEQPVTAQFDVDCINELVRYASRMENFSVSGLTLCQHKITEAVGDYWDLRSTPGSEDLKVFCSDEIPKSLQSELGFSRQPVQSITVMKYPEENFHYEVFSKNFLEKRGKFIGSIQLGFRIRDAPRFQTCVLPIQFISELITYCPNLTSLHLQQCTLALCDYVEKGISKRLSLKILQFDSCLVYSGILTQLSMAFSEINQLRMAFSEINRLHLGVDFPKEHQSLPFVDSPSDPLFEVIMPHTEINRIIIDEVYSGFDVYVKVFAVSYNTYYYYRVGTKGDNRLKKSSEAEYNEKNEEKHIYICSLTKPKIDIQAIRR